MTRTWIIGASSGIGAAVAVELAKRGEMLILSARDAEALERVRQDLSGVGHVVLPLDITDGLAVKASMQWVVDQVGPLDRIVCFAGAYTPMKLGSLNLNEVRKIIDINLMGVFNVVEGALDILKVQGRGQIALCASVAGYRGLPNGQPYAATKAGVISLATSLKAEHGHYLDVKVINPGFVKTRLTDKNDFEMPFQIEPEAAAIAVAKGLESKAFEIHFPKRFTLLIKALSLLPDGLYFRAVKGMR